MDLLEWVFICYVAWRRLKSLYGHETDVPDLEKKNLAVIPTGLFKWRIIPICCIILNLVFSVLYTLDQIFNQAERASGLIVFFYILLDEMAYLFSGFKRNWDIWGCLRICPEKINKEN